LPLPGEPIEIAPGDINAFEKAEDIITQKLQSQSMETGLHIHIDQQPKLILEAEIGIHGVFALKIANQSVIHIESSLRKWINHYLEIRYGKKKVEAVINIELATAIKQYLDRGFQYFVFDMILAPIANESIATQTPIVYLFKSNAAYYPMEISSVDGTGMTRVDIALFTKGSVRKVSGPKCLSIKIGDLNRAKVVANDLKPIEQRLADLFEEEVVGRVLHYTYDMSHSVQEFTWRNSYK
jgi:hypothetical protein